MFNVMKANFPEHYDMLCQKGYYPYEWVDDISKLDHKGLPPMEAFYSELRQKTFSREKMDHVEKVYKALNCETFKDYRLAYLKTDVLLLAYVF